MFNDNYRFLLNKTGKNYSDVARFVKCTPQAARDWDIKNSVPRDASMRKLANFFSVPIAELQYGDLRNEAGDSVYKGKYIPLVHFAELDSFLARPASFARTFHCTRNVTDDAFAVKHEGGEVKGPNESYIHENDIVIIERDDTMKAKSIVLAKVKTSNTYTIKKVSQDMGKSYLTSASPVYGVIPVDDDVEIIGVAKYSIKETKLDK